MDPKPSSTSSRNLPNGSSGLINYGNTCYVNSALQILLHTYLFRHDFLFLKKKDLIRNILINAPKIFESAVKDNHYDPQVLDKIKKILSDKDYQESLRNGDQIFTNDEIQVVLNSTLTYQLIRLFEMMYKENKNYAAVSFIKRFNSCRGKFFFNNDQHDSEEALSCIIQAVHEEVATKPTAVGVSLEKHMDNPDLSNYEKKTLKTGIDSIKKAFYEGHSAILQTFSGFYHSSITCPHDTCRYSNSNFDNFFHLSLALPHTNQMLGHISGHSSGSVTLQQCMNHFTDKEVLDQNNLWKCEGCNQMVAAEKRMTIWSAPPILMIQLKRFSYDRRTKDTRIVQYPLTDLDISPMISDLSAKLDPAKSRTYNLIGVITHIAAFNSLQFGHYIAYCLDPTTKKWYLFNDDHPVREVNESEIEDNKNAYILVYENTQRL